MNFGKTAFAGIVIVLGIGVGANLLHAQAPNLLNYQGKLTTAGTPASGSFNITFSIYATLTGGTALWTETQNNVPVANGGVFNVTLGSASGSSGIPSSVFTGSGERYLGIKVGTDPEMTPRFRLTSVAFAFHATEADGIKDGAIGDVDVSATAAIAGIKINPDFGLQNIFTTGRVSIGATPDPNPSIIFDVNIPSGGSARFGRLLTTGGEVQFTNGRLRSDQSKFQILGQNLLGTTPFPITFGQTAGDVDMMIATDGNVGIGTPTPAAKLDVNGNAFVRGGLELITPTGGTPYLDFSNTNADFDARIILPKDIDKKLIITGAKLGISQNPIESSLFESNLHVNVPASASPVGAMTVDVGSFDNLGNAQNSYFFRVRDTSINSTPFYIRGDGNVGIGTINPEGKLEVNGATFIRGGLELSTAGGPNLDFKDNINDDYDARIKLEGDQLVMRGLNPGFKVAVAGDICANNTTCNSDLRYKKNIAAIPSALDKITRLRGVSFDWRQDEFPKLNFNQGRNLGFIAQEIKAVLPEVVSQDSQGYYSVAYSSVVPVLVEAIKEQQNTMQAQAKELAQTQAALQSLQERMQRLEVLLAKTDRSLPVTGQ